MAREELATKDVEQQLREACAELSRKLRAGDRYAAEDVLAEFPAIAVDPESALELIYTEFVVREELGQQPSAEDWYARFPQWRLDLEELFQVDQAVREDTSGQDEVPTSPAPGKTAARSHAGHHVKEPHNRVGNYELLEEIGRGGMGVVYKARQVGLNRLVALKMMLAGDFASANETARFRTEAEAAARLQHPNIVQIHEVGTHDGLPYCSFEYVEGGSLDERLAEAPLAPRAAAELCETLARAAHYAHEHGIVHRDLKPSNVLLQKVEGGGSSVDGLCPKITDFGLAKKLTPTLKGTEGGLAGNGLTRTGAMLGTPSYMAPEQATGASKQTGPVTDVYGLGAMLYEMLTGRPPFQAASVLETLEQVRSQEPVAPRHLVATLPHDLETICLKCIQKDPRRRYQTAQELADELRRFLKREPIRARRITAVDRAWRWCKRKPLVAALAASLVLVLWSGLAGVTWQWRRAATQAAREARLAERTGRLLYVSDMNLAVQAWDEGDPRELVSLLRRHVPAPGHEDLRGFEWYYLWRLAQQGLRAPSLFHQSSIYHVAFSPKGGKLVSPDGHDVKVWDLVTAESRSLVGHSLQVLAVAVSPDGRDLASGGADRTIRIWDLATGERTSLLSAGAHVMSLGFSPDGTTLAAMCDDGKARLWDIAAGRNFREKFRELSVGPGHYAFSLAFSPDGTKLAAAWFEKGFLKVWDIVTGTELEVLGDDAEGIWSVAISSKNVLAAGRIDGSVALWDLTAGKALGALVGHKGNVRSAAFSPNGAILASGGDDNTVRLWHVATRKPLATLKGHSNFVLCVEFSPDGKTLASASRDATVKLWQLDHIERTCLVDHNGPVYSLTFTPDGNRFVSTSADGTLKVWDADSGELLDTIETAGGEVFSGAFSPDGKRFAAGNSDGKVILWDASMWEILDSRQHEGPVWSVAFVPGGNAIATASHDGTVKLWDLRSDRLRQLGRSALPFQGLAFTPDGSVLAAGNFDSNVYLWGVATGEMLGQLEGYQGRVWPKAFSPNGKILACGGDDSRIVLWDLSHGIAEAVAEGPAFLEGHAGTVNDLAFSPDGAMLASAGGDGTVRLWDLPTGKLRVTFKDHNGNVMSVAFSPDGTMLASTGHDGTVFLRRTATKEEVRAAAW